MKWFKRSIVFLFVICFLLPSIASAETLEEWNLSCRMKTASITTLYALLDNTKVIGSIPANTYVKIRSSVNGWATIAYMTADGVMGSAQVKREALTGANYIMYMKDGTVTDVHELQKNGEMYGNDVLYFIPPVGSELAGSADSLTLIEPSSRKTTEIPVASKNRGTDPNNNQSASAKQDENVSMQSTSRQETVQLKTLGVVKSTIIYDGKTKEVLTDDLVFSQEVAQEKKVAVIYAPKTGKATLRKTASASSSAIKICKAGVIVQVLETGGGFTKVNYQGTVGYVKTNCLKFYGSDVESMGVGVLSYNGKATGSTTINIRNAANGDSAIVAVWKTGTNVTILSKIGNWYEIEAQGFLGFVKQEFLSMKE